MKTNVRKSCRIILMLALVMMLTVVMAACIDTDKVPEVDSEFESRADIEVGGDTSEEEIPPAAEGQTEHPTVEEPVHISPMTVAVYGTCEENAVVRVKCEDVTVEVNSRNGYYIASIDLPNQNGNKLFITAQVEGMEESNAVSIAAFKDATAEKSATSVSVGKDSRLYFDYMMDNYKGGNETLYTLGQLKKIRDNVNNSIKNYKNNAYEQDVEVIYLLVPDVTAVDTSFFPDETEKGEFGSVYDQLIDTLGNGNTRASVIDMRAKLLALKDDPAVLEKGGLYRTTDSSLTDYGAYLVYNELMSHIAKKDPDAKPRTVDEVEWTSVENALGGNLVTYRGLDKSIITENIWKSTPKFSLDLGVDQGSSSSNLLSVAKYINADKKDYNFVTNGDDTDSNKNISERFTVVTDRKELPAAVICRDYSSYAITDYLVERFEKTTVLKSGDFFIDTTNAGTLKDYAADGEKAPDYIIYILSEQNMLTAFKTLIG